MFEATFSIVSSEKKVYKKVGFASLVFKFFCYNSNTVSIYSALNLLLKIVDFENSTSIGAVNQTQNIILYFFLF